MSPTLATRKIGNVDVTALGFGTMGMSVNYGAVGTDEERLQFLDAVYASGETFWDTADVYGDSEKLLGKWFQRSGKRDDIFLATKVGFIFVDGVVSVNGKPEYIKAACEQSLKNLGVDSIDLYYLHRADPKTPIELTIGAMAELVKEGKVKQIGISEVSEATLRRAHAVHPIAALQVEYSPFCLDIEKGSVGLFKACRELGIKIVAYSPLGRGLLTGRYISRFCKENFPKIFSLVDNIKQIGDKHGATSGQVALAWLLAQGVDVIPIPGTRSTKYLKENLGALNVKLTTEELKRVRELAEGLEVVGDRYPPGWADFLLSDTPPL
ncbi:NADP-dependent oxidoreductase domain-containing protein [Amylostereum chailletii]|nr:NADP-dependent oxidoreductase domain-containing protein [Amylostereum chailletii]